LYVGDDDPSSFYTTADYAWRRGSGDGGRGGGCGGGVTAHSIARRRRRRRRRIVGRHVANVRRVARKGTFFSGGGDRTVSLARPADDVSPVGACRPNRQNGRATKYAVLRSVLCRVRRSRNRVTR